MIGPFAIDTVFPAFDRIGMQFGTDDTALQQITSIYLVSFAFTSLFYGPISDAIGRKPVMIVGLSIFSLASLGCALSTELPTLLIFRALQGASAGAGQIIARALARDLYSGAQAQKVMAQITMIFGIAPAVAPIIAGWLLGLGNWPVIFVFLFGYGLVLIALVCLVLPESHPPGERSSFRIGRIISGMIEVGGHLPFIRLAVASSFGFAAQFLYIAGAPIFVVRLLGLGERDFWILFVPMISGLMVGALTNSILAARVRPQRLAKAGMTCMLLGSAGNVALSLSPVATRVPWPILGPTVITFGIALYFPILQLRMLDMFPTRRGSASSLQSFITLLLNALMAGVIVPLVSRDVLTFALTSGFCGLAAVLLWCRHNAREVNHD